MTRGHQLKFDLKKYIFLHVSKFLPLTFKSSFSSSLLSFDDSSRYLSKHMLVLISFANKHKTGTQREARVQFQFFGSKFATFFRVSPFLFDAGSDNLSKHRLVLMFQTHKHKQVHGKISESEGRSGSGTCSSSGFFSLMIFHGKSPSTY